MASRAVGSMVLGILAITHLWSEDPSCFAIRGARVVPVSGPILEQGTVVLRDGRIIAVGIDAPTPMDAWLVEGKGLTVYPGLIDAMTDLGLQIQGSGGTQLPGAVPQSPKPSPLIRGPEDRPGSTPWVLAADDFKLEDKRLEAWRNAGFTAIHTIPTVGVLPGQGAVVSTGSGIRPGDLVIKAPATLQVTFQTLITYPASLMGTHAYLRQTFMDANRYMNVGDSMQGDARGIRRAPYDRTVRTLAEVFKSKRPILLPATTPAQIRRALALAKETALPTVLYGMQQGYAAPNLLAEAGASALVSVKWPEPSKDADPEREDSLRMLRFRDRADTTPFALQKAGVRFAFYSDGLTVPKDVLRNVNRALEAGLSREAALKALTLDAAMVLGVGDRLGSLEVGKIANLVITNGDLFDPKTIIKMVFVDGRKYEPKGSDRPQEPPSGTVTGTWVLTVQTTRGSQSYQAILTMAPDGTLTGTLTGPDINAVLTEGWVSGKRFSFSVNLPGAPGSVPCTFAGSQEDATLKGTCTLPLEVQELSGVRKSSPVPVPEHP